VIVNQGKLFRFCSCSFLYYVRYFNAEPYAFHFLNANLSRYYKVGATMNYFFIFSLAPSLF